MQKFIKNNFFIILLLILSFVLFITNYKPGAFLIGWDNLFPEFNFKLDFHKNLFAVWQQYRGLGVIDGMSHAANLVHDLERLFLSLFLPLNLIRWIYILSMHLLGGLGIYFLLSKNLRISKIIAFFGALFYQYNLATVQQFFLPFEVFVVHFAFLSWLIFWALEFLNKGDKKTLIYFFIFSLLSIPQAHVPTLFLVYFISLTILFIIRLFLYKKFEEFKRILILIFIIFTVNAFWGLPFTYQTLTNAKNIANSKTFQMSSNDIFYRNKKYGDLVSVIYLKSFSLDFKYLDYKTDESRLMMWPWVKHLRSPLFILPAWIFFILAIFGLFYSIKTKNKIYLPFSAVFIFSFFMMGTDIPLISTIVQLLRKYIPLFSTIFRFTFTKFSILYVFSYSILFSIGTYQLLCALHDRIKNIIYLILFLLIIFYTLPSFQGHFFYENLAVKVPDEYFQVFDFFKKQNPEERVAILPIPWYWAWLQPKWGTINSGFIWYGIPQPITDLAFTPWGRENENFYWELEQVIYSKNSQGLKKIFKKYDISWIYLDKNIINSTGKKLNFEEYEQLLSDVGNVNLIRRFNMINIYKVNDNKLNNFVSIKSNLKSVAPSYQYNDIDQAYVEYGDYLSDKTPQVYYPFRSLFAGKSPNDIEFNVTEDTNYLYFKSTLPDEVLNWKLERSNPFDEEFITYDKEYKPKKYNAFISLNKNVLTVAFNKKLTKIYESNNDEAFLNQKNNACEKNPSGKALLQRSGNRLTLTSAGSGNCIKIDLPTINLRYGYLFNIETKNDNQRGFFINFNNQTTKKNDLETYLDNDGKEHNYYFVSSPRGYYDVGYTIYFNNRSEGREVVTNTLKEVNVYQIPYYYLKSIKLINPIKTNNKILYYSQSFHPGWKAYQIDCRNSSLKCKISTFFPFFFGKELKDHVLVNNWANGWKISQNQSNQSDSVKSVVIVFWPQYLEFLGFGLMGLTFVFLIFSKSPKPKKYQ